MTTTSPPAHRTGQQISLQNDNHATPPETIGQAATEPAPVGGNHNENGTNSNLNYDIDHIHNIK